MRVVYSPAHLAHDPVTETVTGAVIPANEVAERAERIRATLEADGGFTIQGPTEHGTEPILAVHDPGLLRYLEEAWPAARAQSIGRPNLIADTYPTFRMFEGMSREFLASRPETGDAGGRAGWWGLDTANPLVAGTYGAARAAADVALTTADLVLGGERTAYGLCRPPGHHAARSMAGGYCFLNNAAIAAESIVRATGERVAILDVDYHHGNGTQQIFWRRGDVLYVSLHADPQRQYPFFLGNADETGEGEGSGANLNLPLPAGTDDADLSRRAGPRAGRHRRHARRGDRRVTRVRHVRPRPDRRLRADDGRLPRVRPTDGGSGSAARDPPGGRLPSAVARRERPGVAARRRGPAVRAAAGGRVRGGRVGSLIAA